MKVSLLPIESIIPYDRNPRKNAGAVEAVKASLLAFGWKQPIVVDEKHVILAGHTRYLAALDLGWKEAPVHIAEGMTADQARAYRLMDNKSHEMAEWDLELLALEIEDLNKTDFDMDLTGFSEGEIKELIASSPELKEKTEDLRPIRRTWILISIPTGITIDELESGLKAATRKGATIDYAGN